MLLCIMCVMMLCVMLLCNVAAFPAINFVCNVLTKQFVAAAVLRKETQLEVW